MLYEWPDLAEAVDATRPLESLAAIASRARALPGQEDLRGLRDRGAPAELLIAAACAMSLDGVKRTLGIDLHDVQLMAGAALCAGWSVQMRTGEGKTFAAIPAALVHACLTGPVHVATANSYLAGRDAEWSGAVLRALGVSVAAALPGQDRAAKRRAYAADVTYASGVDLGFDYLRDQLHLPGGTPVQRSRCVAIVDEADAVLVDDDRTPLVLSGALPARTAELQRVDEVVQSLRLETDVALDQEHHRIELTDAGISRCEELLGVSNLFEPGPVDWPSLVHNALRARALLRRDRDYVVIGGRVEVVDDLTGRIVEGRRWSEGLHQAVEAKERLPISPERHPIARITQGGYFGGYELVVGMSGTLEGAEEELAASYGIRSVIIPTHRPVIRVDHSDAVFAAAREKFAAVVDDVVARNARSQPVLIGTRSIAITRQFSELLRKRGIPHETLTAQDHEREAAVIAEAGRPGAVTVATQMAGRGVDIVLGGGDGSTAEREQVVHAGGLMVWGLEHHPSRRLDMQLRGRAGRQGDPGESCFAACPDDELTALASREVVDGDTLEHAQRRAESLEAELRADVRTYDAAIDALHHHLYTWRERAGRRHELPSLLHHAVKETARCAVDQNVQLPQLAIDELPRFGRWRRRSALEAAIEEHLQARATDIRHAVFDTASELILRTLLVVIWPAALEELETRKSLGRLGSVFGIESRRLWQATAVRCFREFEQSVQVEWVRQLLAFRVGVPPERDGATCRETVPVPPPPHPGGATGDLPVEQPLLHEWEGWSFNRFIRQRLGSGQPEPPIVLVVDAVGEAPSTGGWSLDLDLEDPTLTVIYRAKSRETATDEA